MPDLQKMSKERFTILYHKHLSGSLKGVEREEWLTLLADDELAPELEKSLDWFNVPKEQEIGLSKLKADAMVDSIVQHPQPRGKHVSLWPRIAIAAAVAIMIFGAGLFYYKLNHDKALPEQVALKNDVAPGKQGATLTLANGKKIRLSEAANGELAKEAGVTITKSANGQLVYEIKGDNAESNKINTLSTANGETYQLRLPDGSLVWLNSASSLTYTASLNERGRRVVRLSGEGYFEIAKDKAHPFIVESSGQEVEVLGTHFNINSYADEPVVATTLIEGSVKVSGDGQQQMLRPGEQALNNGAAIKVTKADLETAVDWKNNEFYLEKMDFRVAMRKIARWYNVEVIYSGSVPQNLEAGGWIQRSRNLSDVLKAIEATGLAHFKIEGRRLYVNQ